jgi:hypothetical protein
MTEGETMWDLLITSIKWVIGAFVTTIVFILKGYHKEFADLKQSTDELLRSVKHINDNLKQYDNGTKGNTEAIIELEKEVAELRVEIRYIKEKVK